MTKFRQNKTITFFKQAPYEHIYPSTWNAESLYLSGIFGLYTHNKGTLLHEHGDEQIRAEPGALCVVCGFSRWSKVKPQKAVIFSL